MIAMLCPWHTAVYPELDAKGMASVEFYSCADFTLSTAYLKDAPGGRCFETVLIQGHSRDTKPWTTIEEAREGHALILSVLLRGRA